jgi:hypothetical protein
MRFRSMILLSSLALAACGRSTPAAPPADAARLRAFGTVIATSTEAYLSGYEDLVRPAIEGILAIGPGLDQRVRSRGPEEHADVECGAGAMLAEFERHTDIACTSLDLATNRAETARHAVTMGRWAALAVARADEGGTAAGGSGPHCVRFSDGERVYLP